MKKITFLFLLFIILITVLSFAQTSVRVPNNFIGTWWIDLTDILDTPLGIQTLMSYDIKNDSTWIITVILTAFNQQGRNLFSEHGMGNEQVMVDGSGIITSATSNEIILTLPNSNLVYNKFRIDGNDLIDMNEWRWTRTRPAPRN